MDYDLELPQDQREPWQTQPPTGYVTFDLKPIAWDRITRPRDEGITAEVDESWPICNGDELSLNIKGRTSRYRVLSVSFSDEDDEPRVQTLRLEPLD